MNEEMGLRLDRAIADRAWGTLEALCDECELHVAPEVSPLVAEHMLCLLLMQRPEQARYAFERAGGVVDGADTSSASRDLEMLWRVTCAMHQLEFAQAIGLLDDILGQPQELAPRRLTLVAHLRAEIQSRVLTLVARSHTSIRLEDLAHMLGLSVDQATERCLAREGWSVSMDDGVSGSFVDIPPDSTSSVRFDARVMELGRLTETLFSLHS
mmetsp:Transcript_12215/g.32911  ORF Transcript_12215/g.32911 Transcript_12215/m.32911 type:complete len:212 (+) Transcript_12215:161-796(+)|eukprot:CAMPEP_0185831434 /NCGR_PEP_ID=MMETSP1353-20130828/1485_1 /TAXON_ID=1077150 /ORGANISM="Erythrolobus australicus, Strain CCMP3124" /LENGTH=211 /DNA_ID=CAMNT_0028529491 /DNA_START=125 /DNA_END=760 /DNA_ORIENTATION=+